MRLFLDTNILMDLVDETRANSRVSRALAVLCKGNLIDTFASALSIPNMNYILRHKVTLESAARFNGAFHKWIQFLDLEDEDVVKGFEIGFKDYEDALQALAAQKAEARYIVTWNVKDYKRSVVPAITPEEFFRDVFVGAKI